MPIFFRIFLKLLLKNKNGKNKRKEYLVRKANAKKCPDILPFKRLFKNKIKKDKASNSVP